MTLGYRLFNIPRTTEEFLEKEGGENTRSTISHEIESHTVYPSPKTRIPPFLTYAVWLSVESKSRSGKTFRRETAILRNNTVQAENSEARLLGEARAAIEGRLPELVEMFNRHSASFELEEKTEKLLLGLEKR